MIWYIYIYIYIYIISTVMYILDTGVKSGMWSKEWKYKICVGNKKKGMW